MYCEWPRVLRCCFCMPLRKGILVFGYFNFVYSALMVGVHSYFVQHGVGISVYHIVIVSTPQEILVAIYCLKMIFSAILIYGTHKKVPEYIKVYYYFSISIFVVGLLMHVATFVEATRNLRLLVEVAPLILIALCIQIYLLVLIRSFLKKLENAEGHVYINQLQRFVYDRKMDGGTGVYNDTTVTPVAV